MEAIVLAGGKGERLRSAVPDVPKPMAPVLGRPFLEYLLDYWIMQGIEKFTLATGFCADIIENHFGSSYKGRPISYSTEKEALGTGGGLLLAAKKIKSHDPFLVVNGDTFFEISLKSFCAKHEDHRSLWSIALHAVEYNDRYGSIFLNNQNEIIQFDSALSDAQESLINAGIYLISRRILDRYVWNGKFLSLERELVPKLIASDSKVHGFVFSGRFIDIGIPKDYEAAKNFFKGGVL